MSGLSRNKSWSPHDTLGDTEVSQWCLARRFGEHEFLWLCHMASLGGFLWFKRRRGFWRSVPLISRFPTQNSVEKLGEMWQFHGISYSFIHLLNCFFFIGTFRGGKELCESPGILWHLVVRLLLWLGLLPLLLGSSRRLVSSAWLLQEGCHSGLGRGEVRCQRFSMGVETTNPCGFVGLIQWWQNPTLFGKAKEVTFFFGITTQLQPWWLYILLYIASFSISMVMVSTSISVLTWNNHIASEHLQDFLRVSFFPQEHGRFFTHHKTLWTKNGTNNPRSYQRLERWWVWWLLCGPLRRCFFSSAFFLLMD